MTASMKLNCHRSEVLPFFKCLCDFLLSFLKGETTLSTTSALCSAFQKHLSIVLVDASFREKFTSSVSTVLDLSPGVCKTNVFLPVFTRKFGNRLLAYLVRVITKDANAEFSALETRYAVTYQSTRSLDFKQNMHYIGGSNVKSVIRSALRIKHRNDEWHRVLNTLKDHFLISDFAKAPDSDLMQWTVSVDRGGLTKISGKALDFFVQLGTEVKPLERLDGSLITDEVIDKVSKSAPLLLRWDELKGALSEKESFKLLHSLVHQFCITWRNGIIGRRKDEMDAAAEAQKFGTGGLAMRAVLGGK